MVFEALGFVTGVAVIGAAWMMLLRHERWKVLSGFYAGTPGKAHRGGNALIWPSR